MTEEGPKPDDGHRCDHCGSMSKDPDWCDVCGAEIGAASSAWLETGDRLTVPLRPLESALRAPSLSSIVPLYDSDEDTLPPGKQNETTTPFALTVTAPHKVQSGDLDSARQQRDDGLRETEIELAESLAVLNHKRVWRGRDGDGNLYRVEERATPTREAIPEGIEHLAHIIDLPLAAVSRGGHEFKVYRFVPGRTLHERRMEIESALTPTELVEWIRPLVRALDAIHQAGFLCLRVCPYTVKYTSNGDVFFQNVEVLYPRDAALTTLPAIAGYTAPEVYEASLGRPPDLRADLYGVAMVLYYLIAGGDPPSSLYTSHLPSIRVRDIDPGFPIGFAPVVESIGSADPDQRPASAAQLLGQLELARDRSVRQRAPEDAIRLGIAADTHVGIVKQYHTPENQDAVLACSIEDGTTAMLVVADGVSTATYGSGDLASRLCIRAFAEAWNDYTRQPAATLEQGVDAWLVRTLDRANRDVIDYVNAEFSPFEGEPAEVMGTTCVAAFIQDGHVTLASMGDSRAYLLRDGYIERITRDHNLLTLGIADGLDPDIAVTLPQAEALARCLGAFEMNDDGTLRSMLLEPDVYHFELTARDRLLLCSDGLTDYAGETVEESERVIHRVVVDEAVPELACFALMNAANRGGGGDNIGVALAYAEPVWNDVYDWFTAKRDVGDPELEFADD